MSKKPSSEYRIRILPELIINKIAAGEVVERPASVVKELVENSIDAGADQIFVTIKNGGKDQISVLDNGKGMDEENARLAVERHATSKIYEEDDLDGIDTLGFRGEALASIASVSHFELVSCVDETQGGTRISIKGGTQEEVGKIGFPQGTRITVSQLFCNTPARLKFLKSTPTEFRHIQDGLLHQALARPHIQFRLTHNNQLIFNLSKGQTLEERIYQLYGEEFQDGLIGVQHQETYLKYHGFVSAPNHSRNNRRWQYLFVNNRYVKCPSVHRAISEAYRTLLMKHQHPVYFLKIELDPREIDVNVHPAKTEIRFRNTDLIQTILSDHLHRSLKDAGQRRFFGRDHQEKLEALKQTPVKPSPEPATSLEGQMQMPFLAGSDAGKGQVQKAEQANYRHKTGARPAPSPESRPVWAANNNAPHATSSANATAGAVPAPGPSTAPPAAVNTTVAASVNSATASGTAVAEAENAVVASAYIKNDVAGNDAFHFQPLNRKMSDHQWVANSDLTPEYYQPLGQLDRTYIVASGAEGLVLFDQHAAHERILFEMYRNQFYAGGIRTNAFLVPLLMELSPQNGVLLEQYLPQFKRLGFDIELFGRNTYAIRTIPAILTEPVCKQAILDVLDELNLFGKSGRLEEVFNDVLEKVACHSAIRAGQTLSRQEMNSLVAQLEKLDIHLYCPHGRPVFIEIGVKELEKRFKRVV